MLSYLQSFFRYGIEGKLKLKSTGEIIDGVYYYPEATDKRRPDVSKGEHKMWMFIGNWDGKQYSPNDGKLMRALWDSPMGAGTMDGVSERDDPDALQYNINIARAGGKSRRNRKSNKSKKRRSNKTIRRRRRR